MSLTACQESIFDNQKPNTANELTAITGEKTEKRIKARKRRETKEREFKGRGGKAKGEKEILGVDGDVQALGYTSQRKSARLMENPFLNRPSLVSIAAIDRYMTWKLTVELLRFSVGEDFSNNDTVDLQQI